MSRGQTLRALVNERLAAAAEDIFVLFERTIAEYEEKLCRSKEENQRKQLLLDTRIKLARGNVQIPSSSSDPGLNQEITETPCIKKEPEEQSVKQEEEQLPVPVPESSAVCVKTEESSLLQETQTQEEDISSEPHFHSETEGHTEHSNDIDNDDHWEPFSWSAAQMETEPDGDHYNQVQIRDRITKLSPKNTSVPATSVHSGHMLGADGGAERKKHQCPFCIKRFVTKQVLQMHIRVHTGERPYGCSTCEKAFTQRGHLDKHMRTHTGEKPYSCSVCEKTFAQKCNLDLHVRTHTGERPYSCLYCEKRFTLKGTLDKHMRTHTGEKPFSCTVCNKAFSQKSRLKYHMSVHRGQSV